MMPFRRRRQRRAAAATGAPPRRRRRASAACRAAGRSRPPSCRSADFILIAAFIFAVSFFSLIAEFAFLFEVIPRFISSSYFL